MGRYYYSGSGRSGKFMFGVQNSTDPEYMGMHEEEPTNINYYAGAEDVDYVTSKLDEQYDILGLEQEHRIYSFKELLRPGENGIEKEEIRYQEWEDKYLHDKVWETVKEEEVENKTGVRWASDKEGCVDLELGDGLCLALARVRLGLIILSDIEDNADCNLEAEL